MPLQRLARHLGHRAWFVKLGKAIVPFDRAMAKLTGGRVVALGVVPSLILTTTGRKSGLARSQPLAYVPDGDDIILIGSNWGGPNHPAWSGNLIANPAAKVNVKGREKSVTARLLTGAERDEAWRLAVQVWPPYATYEKRCAPRVIRVFRLTTG
ncbi:nitroreductase family deazaflavin-dependent oxidoreductase [Allorhizocola rhizosphaerae]|uniref:nitroreductase family deazaflavin-dependent oxidoreductase n=1 Tax=Allorhizocola rhizosphaerae TaxID=1872709 RepID=UPI000E3CAD1E|nr:nitroreductase family deazaflavin-dependent oxidoreductase [Allorhizocola rhizosphaerae]